VEHDRTLPAESVGGSTSTLLGADLLRAVQTVRKSLHHHSTLRLRFTADRGGFGDIASDQTAVASVSTVSMPHDASRRSIRPTGGRHDSLD
jgi:hypothetical protein